MSKNLKKAIKTLWYNSVVQIIDNMNKTNNDETKDDETKVSKKFVGYNEKLKKNWDTLENRNNNVKVKGLLKPASLGKGTMDFIIDKINDKKIIDISTEKKDLIKKYTDRDWGLAKDIEKELKNSKITSDQLINYIKQLAFIAASIAYNGNKKYILNKEIIATFDSYL